MAKLTDYEYISEKIEAMKEMYPSLRDKPDSYVFSGLAVKSNFYKNPALTFYEDYFNEFIVDGAYDGGADVLLSDPNSDENDMIIGQSKFKEKISQEECLNAMTKMIMFYQSMEKGQYEQVNEKVQEKFMTFNAEVGDESKVVFVLYTSAQKGSVKINKLEKIFREYLPDSNKYKLELYFGSDIVEEIKESESRRASVEQGKIKIDSVNNFLEYGENAVIVNVSAFSIKTLYAQHNKNLLSRNLRYHVAGREIDKDIAKTISEEPETFWLKNNGLTILCDQFEIDGKEVKLKNFSIVNGGQTTHMISKSKDISEDNDLYLVCKIIEIEGDNEDEKNKFSLSIAKATNSQKPIKKVDLKANSPEQIRFSNAMREANLFYQTKRGEVVPKAFKLPYLNTDSFEVGKLCLSAIFQMPGTSRNKPSCVFDNPYYDVIFDGNQKQIASLCKEFLYIDHYYRNDFLKDYRKEKKNTAQGANLIAFAQNARTICLSFVSLVARYLQDNITESDIMLICEAANKNSATEKMRDAIIDLGNVKHLFDPSIFNDKEKYDALLYKLFNLIISEGNKFYTIQRNYEEGLNVANYLKKDKNYYSIIKGSWDSLINLAKTILNGF